MSSTARRDCSSTRTRSFRIPHQLHPSVNWSTVCWHIYFSPYTLSRNATLSAGITTVVPSLFATENISHHSRTNICFSIAGEGEGGGEAFSVPYARLQVVDTTETAIRKLPTCNWDSEIILTPPLLLSSFLLAAQSRFCS